MPAFAEGHEATGPCHTPNRCGKGFFYYLCSVKILRNISFGLAAVLTVVLIIATIAERFAGNRIYHTPGMITLWLLTTLSGGLYLLCRRRWLTLGSALLHIAFIVILSGAAITFFRGHEGKIMLHTDGPPADIYLDTEGRFRPLGFEIRLLTPAHFQSIVTINQTDTSTIAVNHPLSVGRIRLYQTSVSTATSTLIITDDSAGRTVTFTGYLLLALAAVIMVSHPPRRREQTGAKLGHTWLTTVSFALLALQTAAILMKWLIFHRPPMADGGQALQIMAWASLAIATAASRRYHIISSSALMVGGLLLIAGIVSGTWVRNAPLVPALDSPLLALHVVTVMSAYALFAVMTIVSARGMISPHSASQSAALSRSLALPAVLLLCAGIFIGALWADRAWGRYWGWDPKETWALVTLLVYALPFHSRSFPALSRPSVANTYYLLAFLSVAITYFGVNYLFGGLHSYA